MKIIVEHEKEKIQSRLQSALRNQFVIANKNSSKRKCCRCNCFKNFSFKNLFKRQEEESTYINEHPIDSFVDNYFLINCPDNISILEQNDRVYKLIQILLRKDDEYEKLTNNLMKLQNPTHRKTNLSLISGRTM